MKQVKITRFVRNALTCRRALAPERAAASRPNAFRCLVRAPPARPRPAPVGEPRCFTSRSRLLAASPRDRVALALSPAPMRLRRRRRSRSIRTRARSSVASALRLRTVCVQHSFVCSVSSNAYTTALPHLFLSRLVPCAFVFSSTNERGKRNAINGAERIPLHTSHTCTLAVTRELKLT